jgi:hypothetical protein
MFAPASRHRSRELYGSTGLLRLQVRSYKTTTGWYRLKESAYFLCCRYAKSSEKCESSIAAEQFPVPDISRQHGIRGVAGLLANFPTRYSCLSRACCQSRPETMAGIVLRIDTGRANPLANDQAHTFA